MRMRNCPLIAGVRDAENTTMEWVNITGSELIQAARRHGLALLPLGSIEAHADHLPLGNDTFRVHRACVDAAAQEAAVVLPPLYYTETRSMQAAPGAISMRSRVLIDSVLDICDEVARNGFEKILLVSGHGGGNRHWIDFFMTEWLSLGRKYCVYCWHMPLLGEEANKSLMESAFDGHGGEAETSMALHLFPGLCKLKGRWRATQAAAVPDLKGVTTPYDWMARWPQAVSGDPVPATAEKGRVFYDSGVKALCAAIRAVKGDTFTSAFQERYQQARKSPSWPVALGANSGDR